MDNREKQVGGDKPPVSCFKGCASDASPPHIVPLEITPTLEEYEQLCRDLARLRKLGALSNTAAVVAAVSAAAAGKVSADKCKRAGRRDERPRHGSRRSSPDAGQR